MPKIAYRPTKISDASARIIHMANIIIEEYAVQGFSLTLRSLYYKFIARDLFPADWIDTKYNEKHGLARDTKNTKKNYARLGDIVDVGRLNGLIDWRALQDITRGVERSATWTEPQAIINDCAEQFRIDPWATQPYRVEIWIEKDALEGIFQPICNELDMRLPFLSCRGYLSQAEMWRSAQRLISYNRDRHSIGAAGKSKQKLLILHFGDHDPSGIDMTRDIGDRLSMFGVSNLTIKRVALNIDQVEQYNPPPNPAKSVDPRFRQYAESFGDESWEIDALEPSAIRDMLRTEVLAVRDKRKWREAMSEEESHRASLSRTSERWHEVCEFLEQ